MEDYRLDQSGQEVQDILNGAAMQVDLTAETERATEAEQTLQGNIDAEETRAHGAEDTLQDNIDAEESRAKAAEKQNADDIDAIEEKIPSGASSSNKLATEEYVADAVATATATFRGTYNLVSDLHLTVNATEQQIAAALAGAISTADNNDYCFILVPTSSETPTEIKEIDRYKFNGTAWGFEYKLNNSGFTAAQWSAINSGITSGDVAKLAALPTNAQLTTLLAGLQSDIDGEEARAKGAEGTLQDNIDAEETRAKAAEKQNADDIDAIEAVLPENASSENKVATESEIDSLSAAIEAILLLIPSAATSLNKLADKAFVNSSIATATATFRGTYNLVDDLGLTTSATHAQIATALAGAILTDDNNDYAFVQIPTSDAMPTEIAKTERYKFNGTAWEYEYDLNNSGFTADQWAAINSGITQALVTKLSALPTNAELTTELGTLTSGINTINQKIPNAASQANKLVDTAAMESYIVQVLDVLTASFNVTSTDGHVTVQISQVDGKITSVAVSTSDIASAADLNLKASQADLTALASRVTTAEGNITTLGGRMTTAEGNITSLGGRMTTAEGNITTINGNITSLGGRVSTNETDIANLQQLYNDLQQSKPVPVTALPETGQQQGVIYRLAGTTSYSDYMWNGSTWVLMATYNNAIDDVPIAESDNLVKSGGVYDFVSANTFLEVKNLADSLNVEYGKYYVNYGGNIGTADTSNDYGILPKIRLLKGHTYYLIFASTGNTFNHFAKPDGTYIGNIATYLTTYESRGTLNVGIIQPTQDCDLCATITNTDNSRRIMVTEGWVPLGYYQYGETIVNLYKGNPVVPFNDIIDVESFNIFGISSIVNYIKGATQSRKSWQNVTLKLGSNTYVVNNEIELPDGLSFEGVSEKETIIDYVPQNPSDEDVSEKSLFLIKGSVSFKNLTLQAINARYVVHHESANYTKDWNVLLENCVIKHFANNTGSWTNQHAWGEGASSGAFLYAKNCVFITESSYSQNASFSVHNNQLFDKPMYHQFDNCQFLSPNSGCAFRCEGQVSGQDDKCVLNGCFLHGSFYSVNSQSIKIIVSGTNLVQTNASTYYIENSVAEYQEFIKLLKNDTGETIPAGTIVAYSTMGTCEPANEGDIIAGFTIGDTADGDFCKIVAVGYYRTPTVSSFGTKYSVLDGALVEDEDGAIAVATGYGFAFIRGEFV